MLTSEEIARNVRRRVLDDRNAGETLKNQRKITARNGAGISFDFQALRRDGSNVRNPSALDRSAGSWQWRGCPP